MCKGIILNGESLYLLCCCYIIAEKNEEDLNNDQRNLIFTIKLKAPNLSLGALLIYLLFNSTRTFPSLFKSSNFFSETL